MTNRLLPALALAAFAWSAQAQSIDRVEPPFWWTGMKHRPLQLMLHGSQLAGLAVRVQRPGVTLKRSIALPNPDYLVLELEIAPGAKPGPLTIELQRAGRTVLSQPYELRARQAGSAQRQGFGPGDAIYLVVPDRFADGDPSNDNVEGYGDTADRANKGGRHGGDLKGIADHVDYIAGLGFTQLWPTSRREPPAGLFVPRLLCHRPLPRRPAPGQQRGLPAARAAGTGQGPRRDHGPRAQPHRLGPLVDEGPARAGLAEQRAAA